MRSYIQQLHTHTPLQVTARLPLLLFLTFIREQTGGNFQVFSVDAAVLECVFFCFILHVVHFCSARDWELRAKYPLPSSSSSLPHPRSPRASSVPIPKPFFSSVFLVHDDTGTCLAVDGAAPNAKRHWHMPVGGGSTRPFNGFALAGTSLALHCHNRLASTSFPSGRCPCGVAGGAGAAVAVVATRVWHVFVWANDFVA